MATRNPHRLSQSGPIGPGSAFPEWFEDGNGIRLELVTRPDPMAPAIGELQTPAAPVTFPHNFPEEAFYFMAEARLEVGGHGEIGRARVIMALEAAFGGDGEQEAVPGVANPAIVFSRLRVRIDDVVPGATYVVRHPYGETKELEADEGGRVFYTCDLGICEHDPARVLTSGEIAPFLVWSGAQPPNHIGDGITEHAVVGGPFRNHVEIDGPGIEQGSADAAGLDRVAKALFTVQGRRAGTGDSLPPPPPGGPVAFQILGADYRSSRAQFRVRGQLLPVSIADGAGGFQSDRVDVTFAGEALGSGFPDATGAWEVRRTLVGPGKPVPGPASRLQITTASGKAANPLLRIRK